MIGWLITLAILLILWFLPLGIRAVYNADGPVVALLIGPFRSRIYPNKKKKKDKPIENKTKKQDKNRADSKSGGNISEFFPIVKLMLAFLGDLRKKLRVNRLEMKIIMAASDPCDLAVNYGKTWAAVGSLFPQLERVFVIKKRNVEVMCDFTAEQTLIFARIDVTITLGRILCLGVRHGVQILREFLKIMKSRKGGMNHEPKSS